MYTYLLDIALLLFKCEVIILNQEWKFPKIRELFLAVIIRFLVRLTLLSLFLLIIMIVLFLGLNSTLTTT